MTDKKTLECEIEEYALEIEQKAKEIGKLKDILDRKEQQLKQMTEEETLALIKKWSPLLDKEQSPNVKAMLIESQETKVKETDKVLIEGDYATIMGVKYKRVEEPKPKKLFDVIRNLGYSVDMCYEIVDAVENCLPNRLKYDGEAYQLGWNDAITTIKDGLG